MFDSTLKVALAVALEQSPFLKVFPDERAHEDLRLMQRSPNEGISRSLAREIAQREQLKALVAGSIASLGRHYVVGLEAVNAESGDVMAREQVEVNSKEEVLTSLGAAVSRLRRKLGESLTSIQRYDVPLPQGTTPSLEALQAYALALDEGRINPRMEAIPHLQRAIQLDPNFALAQAQLSGVYANTGQSALAPEWSRRAFELRDRVSERERYFISWRYYRDAIQAWDKGLELARSWTAAYPREAFAFNSVGLAAWGLGQYQQAVAPLRNRAARSQVHSAHLESDGDADGAEPIRRGQEGARSAARREDRSHRAWPGGLRPGIHRQRHGGDDARTGRGSRRTGRALGVQLAAAHRGLWRPDREGPRGVSPERRGDEPGTPYRTVGPLRRARRHLSRGGRPVCGSAYARRPRPFV